MAKKPKRTRWASCNMLEIGTESRHLWRFAAGKNGFSLDEEQALMADAPLPAGVVAKDWRTLFQPKLNIALLPIDKVFMRVVHLPVTDFDETVSMVELQLEKLSPLPVTQIVWTIQLLPHPVDNLKTVIVVIATRDLVEECLGKLETQGYLADRVEVPLLDQLLATPITGDGAWIYPSSVIGRYSALVAWWYGGVLRNLGVVHVPAGDNASKLLQEQLTQMAWAGELDGWMTSPPNWHLVADDLTSAAWQPLFRAWLGQAVEVIAPLSPSELVVLTANRAARAEAKANMLPAEYSTRYEQQFFDRLWMRGLGSVLTLYVVGVMIYFAALSIQNMYADNAERAASANSGSYTNALKDKALLQILQDREALKFASLECWKITAELLPEGLTIQNLDFKSGKLTLNGTAAGDQTRLVDDFNNALRKVTATNGLPLFASLELPLHRLSPDRSTLNWSFSGELARSEEAR